MYLYGLSNKKIAREIAAVCQMSRAEIMEQMDHVYHLSEDLYLGFKSAKHGEAKILAVAHIDYIGTGKVYCASRKRVRSSALDDRLGVWFALNIERLTGIPVDIVLTDGEESGRSTADRVPDSYLNTYNWIVEFDREGLTPVYYGYSEMEDPLTEAFGSTTWGTYSDISEWETEITVGAYNHGVGYKLQHTEFCQVRITDVRRSLSNFVKMYDMWGDVIIEHDPDMVYQFREFNYEDIARQYGYGWEDKYIPPVGTDLYAEELEEWEKYYKAQEQLMMEG
jgi:hypothetical protein